MAYPLRLAAQDHRQTDIQVKQIPRFTRNDQFGMATDGHGLERDHHIHMAAPVAALLGAGRAAIHHLRQVEAQAEVLPERIAQAGADAGDAYVRRGERARWNVLIVAAAKVVEPKPAQTAPLLDHFGRVNLGIDDIDAVSRDGTLVET